MIPECLNPSEHYSTSTGLYCDVIKCLFDFLAVRSLFETENLDMVKTRIRRLTRIHVSDQCDPSKYTKVYIKGETGKEKKGNDDRNNKQPVSNYTRAISSC